MSVKRKVTFPLGSCRIRSSSDKRFLGTSSAERCPGKQRLRVRMRVRACLRTMQLFAVRCSREPPICRLFQFVAVVAVRLDGLLIPRSKVRILHGPLLKGLQMV